jgi:hypothetical protein
MRRLLVGLKTRLDALLWARWGKRLVYRSMARFDQQVTTKFHLDGGPAESFLMLGYEPSDVESTLAMADYSRASWELGIEPGRFLTDLNPMFSGGTRLLEPFVTPVAAFDHRRANVLVVNNSSLPFDVSGRNLVGVMHQATIARPDPDKRRVINSTMLFAAPSVEDEEVGVRQQADFVVTSRISGRDDYSAVQA